MTITRRRLFGLVAAIAAIGVVKPEPALADVNEVQTLTLPAAPLTGGAYTLTYLGQTTAPVQWYENITAAEACDRILNEAGWPEGDRALLSMSGWPEVSPADAGRISKEWAERYKRPDCVWMA